MTNELNLNKRLRLQLFAPPKTVQSDELELSQIVSLIGQTRKQKLGFYIKLFLPKVLRKRLGKSSGPFSMGIKLRRFVKKS